MSEEWLRCVVQKGMFSDEQLVLIVTATGESVAFFVPKDQIRENRVRVRSFSENSRRWAVVPNENQSIVAVEDSELVPA